MKKQLFPLLLLALIGFITCEKQTCNPSNDTFVLSFKPSFGFFRSYAEAEDWAKYSISLLDNVPTKSGNCREIESGMCYGFPAAKSGDLHNNDSLIYVFNFKNNEGFTIIAANKENPPLVAITESGHYVPGENTGVEPFDLYIGDILKSMNSHDSLPEFPHSYYEYYELKDSCNARVDTKWGQTGVYGQYCPNGICGCVATALGQIMTYKQYPSSFVATVAMGNDYAVGDTIVLNWPLISQHIINHSGTVQSCDSVHNQIGALLREIGDLVYMNYKTNSSSAYCSNLVYALDTFGFNYSSYSSVDISTMKSSIKSNSPVFVCGWAESNEGHAWVADGYKDFEYWRKLYIAHHINNGMAFYRLHSTEMYASTKLMHFNWGWNGVCNGYFAFNSYDTSGGVIYDGTDNYAAYDFANSPMMYSNIGY